MSLNGYSYVEGNPLNDAVASTVDVMAESKSVTVDHAGGVVEIDFQLENTIIVRWFRRHTTPQN
jgi:hypothetical protein